MQKWRQWEAASEAEWGLALEREAVIRPLAEQEKLKILQVAEAMHRLRIGRVFSMIWYTVTSSGPRLPRCFLGREGVMLTSMFLTVTASSY